MNILVTTENFAGGGLETHIYSYYLQMRQTNRMVFAVGRKTSKLAFEQGDVYTGFFFNRDCSIEEFVKDVDRLVEIIHTQRIDVIHAHPFFSFFPAVVASQLTQVPIVCTYHGIASFSFSERLIDTILYQYFYEELVSKIFTVSETGKNAIQSRMHVDEVCFLPNAVDVSQYSQHTINNNKVWAAISRLDADNGKEAALKKLFLLLPSLDIDRIDVYGDGTRRIALEEYVVEHNLQNKVFFKGFHDDLFQRLNGNYNGIIGTDRVAVEGLTMGYPVMELGYGRINGIIDDELLEKAKYTNFDANILPPKESPEVLNEQLMSVYSNPEDFNHREKMLKDFDIAAIANKYLEEIKTVKFKPHANVVEFSWAIRGLANQAEQFYTSQAVFAMMKSFIEYYAVIPSVKLLFLLGGECINLRNTIAYLQDHGGFGGKVLSDEEIHTPKKDFLRVYNYIRKKVKRIFLRIRK